MNYEIYNNDGRSSISFIYENGEPVSLTNEHPNFIEVRDYIQNGGEDEQKLRDLLNPALRAGDVLNKLDERLTYTANQIFLDGDPIHGTIAKTILNFIREGVHENKYKYLVKFIHKLYQNPSEDSRNSLFDYLQRHNFAITPDGDFIAYKGVTAEGLSIHSGTAIVDNVVIKGQIPNSVGSVIEMPRSKVDSNVKEGCSHGLHAGTYDFARRFGQGRLLKVTVNPRDVVSVPEDANWQKIRTCRYVVLEESDFEWTEPTYDEGYDDEDDDYYNDFDDEEDDDEDDLSDVLDNLNGFNYRNDVPPAAVVTPQTPVSFLKVPTENTVKAETVVEDNEVKDNTAIAAFFTDAINNGAKTAFSYTTLANEAREVSGFTPEKIDARQTAVIGKNADDQYRSYKLDTIVDPVSYQPGS